MADFATAYSLLAPYEAGYVDDADDQGGETIDGIARVHHPAWPGWPLIDAYKRAASDARPFLLTPAQWSTLRPLIVDFYRAEFWDRLRGTDLASQAIADELLEAAVLLGRDRAVRFLQIALNLANDRARRWGELVVSGQVDADTVEAVRAALRTRRDHYVVTLQNIQQGAHFIARYQARPVNEKFIGWLNRVTLQRERRP